MIASEHGSFRVFQHTAARRRLQLAAGKYNAISLFQHTAARRRLLLFQPSQAAVVLFQHTAARRRLHTNHQETASNQIVSTHSRPKAAAEYLLSYGVMGKFQHTAARRRLQQLILHTTNN